MSLQLENFLQQKNYSQSLYEAENFPYLYLMLTKSLAPIFSPEKKLVYNLVQKISEIKKPCQRVKLLCNWCTSEQLAKLWNKMSQGNFTWDNIQIVWDDPVDFY